MRIEHFYFSPSTATKWAQDAKHIKVNAAPPTSTLEHTHAFGSVAFGQSSEIGNDEATGRFVAIAMELGEKGKPIVYTHSSPDPAKPTGDAREVGIFDHDALALICVPARPNRLVRGYDGLAKNQITAAQLEVADRVCKAAELPLPRVAGRPDMGGLWSDQSVAEKLEALTL